jgi:glutamate:Na+ symporter, ESS family
MHFESFTTFNIAILVLALGSWLNGKIKILRDFNIPEPVTSGLLVCVVTAVLYSIFLKSLSPSPRAIFCCSIFLRRSA